MSRSVLHLAKQNVAQQRRIEAARRRTNAILEYPLQGAGDGGKRLWDLYDRGDESAMLRVHAKAAWIAGLPIALAAGTGASGSGDDFLLSFAADRLAIYVVLKRTDSGGTATVTCSGATAPDGDDDEEIYPLWEVEWDSEGGKVDWSTLFELRGGTVRWIGGA